MKHAKSSPQKSVLGLPNWDTELSAMSSSGHVFISFPFSCHEQQQQLLLKAVLRELSIWAAFKSRFYDGQSSELDDAIINL